MRVWHAAVGALVVAGSLSAWFFKAHGDELQAVAILTRANERENRQSYVAWGQTGVRFCQSTISSRVKIYKARRQFRIEYLDPKPPFVQGSDGHLCWAMTGGNSVMTFNHRAPSRGTLDEELSVDFLLHAYEPQLLPQQVQAGRPCFVVGFADRKSGKLVRKIWLDQKSFVPLAWAHYSPSGQVVARTKIERISFESVPAQILRPPARLSGQRQARAGEKSGGQMREPAAHLSRLPDVSSLERRVGFKMLMPEYLPKGFRLQGVYLSRCIHGCGREIGQLRYTDGLRLLTVSESSKQHAGCPFCGSRRSLGACSRAIIDIGPVRAAVRADRRVWAVVMGDLPSEEIEKVSSSLR
jgi:negative regulator of sigma E activity